MAYLTCLALLIAAAAEPSIPYQAPQVSYLFAFDISLSMRVEDAGGRSRLEAAKQMVLRATDHLPPGSKVSIAVFVGAQSQLLLRAHPAADRQTIARALELVRWDNAWAAGSYLANALAQVVDKAGREWGLPKPLNLLVFTDGGSPEPVSVPLSTGPQGIQLTLVGMGETIPSPVPGGEGDACLHDPRNGECFVSRLEEDHLQTLAAYAGGRYVAARSLKGKEQALFEDYRSGTPIAVSYPVGWLLAAGALAAFLVGVVL